MNRFWDFQLTGAPPRLSWVVRRPEGIGVAVAEQPATRCCDECGSDYIATTSQMSQLCLECAHWLYGYPPCGHEFAGGRCLRCGWDGSVSAYLRKLQSQPAE